jgi:hypothetical protein
MAKDELDIQEALADVEFSAPKHAGGRPTIVDAVVLSKLEAAFSMGCTDNEACIYADISPATLYNYQNRTPEFLERKTLLKEKPILRARITVITSLKKDVNSAWKFLEKKDPSLGNKQMLDVTTKGESLNGSAETIEELTKQLNALHRGTSIGSDGEATSPLGDEAQD